jgi:hypothetical protein
MSSTRKWQASPSRVAGHEQGAILGLAKGSKEGGQFGDGKDLGQSGGLPLGERNLADFGRATQGDAIKKLEGGVGLAYSVSLAAAAGELCR